MGRRSIVLMFMSGALLAAATGCASRPPAPTVQATARTAAPAASRPAGPADLALDDIEPRPVLDPPRPPAAAAATRPSVEAVVLYARARNAQLDGRTSDAVSFLERAAILDPDSYEVHYSLGKAYRAAASADPRATREMEQAAAIEPDHLDAQLDLGRAALARGDAGEALRRLRLALETADYKADAPRSIEVDLFLAHALQAQGYDRAALARYERLLDRLAGNGLPYGANPEMAGQITGRLYQTVGDLYVRQGRADRALAAYERAGEQVDDFDLRSRVVRTLLVVGRTDDAKARAADAIVRFRASAESVNLLREVHRVLGREAGAADQLAALRARRPDDRSLLFALADVLRAGQRGGEAHALLADAAARAPADAAILRRRVALYEADGDPGAAVRAWVESVARAPELAADADDAWPRLLRPRNRAKFGLDALRAMPVAEDARAAKAYAVWRCASAWPRRSVARAALDEAVAARPPFAPAFRQRLDELWDDASLGDDARAAAARQLAADAARAGDGSLAAELRGRLLMKQGDAAGAAAALAEAASLAKPVAASSPSPSPSSSPQLQLAVATSLLAFDDADGFERLVNRLLADHPSYAPAQVALYEHLAAGPSPERAAKVARDWMRADPQGLGPRLLQAREQVRRNHPEVAEAVLTGLTADYGDDPAALAGLYALVSRDGRTQQFVDRAEAQLAREPRSFNAADRLARAYLSLGRTADASRVLDAARAAAAGEPDVLYELSHLYAKANQPETAEQVLADVLRLDPAHPPASNDLGYLWAEQGRNLDQAEGLVRSAVRAEPANPSMLDSLGWVLYKRGQFEEARRALARAVGDDHPLDNATTLPAAVTRPTSATAPAANAGPTADPVALDHMGDVMYRLNDRESAGWYWERSRVRLASLGGDDRDDLRPLRLQLQQKQRQLQSGEPVSVAPVADGPPATGPSRAARLGAGVR